MKPLFRIPLSAIALTAFVFIGSHPLRAQDDPARRAAAESLLGAMHTDKLVENNTNRLTGLVDQFSQSASQQGGQLTPEQADTMKKAEDEARDTIRKELGYPVLKEEFVKGYVEAFSEAEIKELTAFYNTPTGQKLLEKQPAITDQVGKIAQGKMRTVMPGVVAKLRETAQKVMPPPPSPVVPAPSGAPVPPPAPGMVPPPPPGLPPVRPVDPAAPAPPTMPVPPAAPARPTAVTPPVTTSSVPVMPTPLPTASGLPTPSAQ